MSIYVHIQDKVISFFFNNVLVMQSDQNLLKRKMPVNLIPLHNTEIIIL